MSDPPPVVTGLRVKDLAAKYDAWEKRNTELATQALQRPARKEPITPRAKKEEEQETAVAKAEQILLPEEEEEEEEEGAEEAGEEEKADEEPPEDADKEKDKEVDEESPEETAADAAPRAAEAELKPGTEDDSFTQEELDRFQLNAQQIQEAVNLLKLPEAAIKSYSDGVKSYAFVKVTQGPNLPSAHTVLSTT